MALTRRIGAVVCQQKALVVAPYFTTARIVMNNKSVAVDETLAKNPFYEKYASKITVLRQNDPAKLAEKLDQLTSKKKESKQAADTGFSTPAVCPKKLGQPESRGGYTQSPTKRLDTIMKTELLRDKTEEEIKLLWHEYFKDKVTVSAVLPKSVYGQLHERAMKYPAFLFALPREGGYEFMVCQFAGNEAHFTSLINFQTYGENAPECLTLVYYPDLAEEKGIVLLRGDYDKNILNGQEAQCLVNQLMLYYANPDDRKLRLLEQFSKEPNTFQHMDLVSELENIKLH